jgi:serine/threonine protein kinase
VKMIHSHLSNDPSFVKRFEEEAAIVAQLRHENIVQVFDFDHEEQTFYMILEYIVGETLDERLKRLNAQNRSMELTEALRIIIQICDAVGYAHGRGMIHRDIKPANIMLDIYGRAVLMDFGISRMVGSQLHTATGAVIGTAKYMSPEQIRGEKIDARVDLYSLGVTLFETISGRSPYEADTAMTLMMMHLNDPVPDIRELKPETPDDIVSVISRAMEKDRNTRYQTAAEMSADLRRIYTRITGVKIQYSEPKGADGTSTLIEPALEGQTEIEKVTKTPTENKPPGTQRTDQPRNQSAAIQTRQQVQNAPVEAQKISGGAGVKNKKENAPSPGKEVGSIQPAGTPAPPQGLGRRFFLLGGGAVLTIGLIVLALLILPSFSAFGTVKPSHSPTALQSEAASTNTGNAIKQVPITGPSSSPTTQLVLTQTATIPTNGPYIHIDTIQIQNGRYVVNYHIFNYQEQLSGTHEHFFFNTVAPDQAGMPGNGPWVLYGGPSPFRGLTVANRPPGSTQLCTLVANADHSVLPKTGNCVDLPN